MTTHTVDVRETAHFAPREPRNDFVFYMKEQLQLRTRLTIRASAVVRDTLRARESTRTRSYTVLRETARATSIISSAIQTSMKVRDTAYLDDQLSGGARAVILVKDSAQLNDRTAQHVKARLREVLTVADRPTIRATYAATLREKFQVTDKVTSARSFTVRDSLGAETAVYARVISVVQARDAATLRSRAVSVVAQLNKLRDTARLKSRASSALRSGAVVREVVYADSRAVPPAYGRAYTCSVITWGMSRFENFPFLTMTSKYAAGKNLWALNAPDDYGTPIDSHITTGVLDMGNSQLKRPTGVYAAGSSNAPLTVTVTGDVAGKKMSYDYTMELRDQMDYRNNRALIGKGFRSRFVQLRFKTNTASYRLLNAELDVATTERRI